MRIGSLFSGTGGLDQGVQAVLGGSVAWHSEIDPGACKILAHRHPDVPNLGDITAVDWSAVEPVDVFTGGFPCQDVSAAGKRAGLHSETRSGLWAQMVRAIDELRPSLVVAENVRGLLSACALSDLEPCPRCLGDESQPHRPVLRALGRVVGDLSGLGYVGRWGGLRAADVGAPHGRFRVFIVAWPAAVAHDLRRECEGASGRRAELAAVAGDQRTPADADGLGHERGRRARDGRPGPADGGVTAADASSDRRDEGRTEPARLLRGSDAALGGHAATDSNGDGLEGVGRVHALGRDANRRRSQDRDGHAAEHATPADTEGRRGPDESGGLSGLQVGAIAGAGSGDRAGNPAEGVHLLGGTAPELAWGPYGGAIQRWEAVLGRPAPSPTEMSAKGSPRLSPRFVEWMMGLPAGWVTDVPGLGRNEMLKALGNGVVPAQCAAALQLLLPDAFGAVA